MCGKQRPSDLVTHNSYLFKMKLTMTLVKDVSGWTMRDCKMEVLRSPAVQTSQNQTDAAVLEEFHAFILLVLAPHFFFMCSLKYPGI